jgi:hypothetical protein
MAFVEASRALVENGIARGRPHAIRNHRGK